jgi:hypothetical protein
VLDPAVDFGDCPTRSHAEEKMKLAIIILLTLLLFVPAAIADGAFIPATATAKVTISDQRALIHFADGIQTLVIDTSLTSSETNLAWIVPLPAEPELEATTRGLFTTLAMITAPRIFHDQSHGWIGVAVLIGSLAFVIGVCIRKHPRRTDIVVLYVFGLLFAGLMLPALAKGHAGVSATNSTIAILSRETVGSYDTVTLRTTDAAELLEWLNEQGFETPRDHLPVLQQYARDGWVFVAARVRADASGGPLRVHPVAFRFPTDRAVYPLKLTAVNNGECRFELYVFGDRRAAIPGWKVERCGRLVQQDVALYRQLPKDGLALAHPELIRLAGKSDVGTKLSATLTPAQMAEDAWVGWESFSEKHPLVFSRQGARKLALNILVCGAIAVGAGFYLLGGFKVFGFVNRRRIWLSGLGLVLVASVGLLWFTPQVEVASSRRPAHANQFNANHVPLLVWHGWYERQEELHGDEFDQVVTSVSLQDVQDEMARALAEVDKKFGRNPYTGEQVMEEDSPGNYTLTQVGDAVDIHWFNLAGGILSHQRLTVEGIEELPATD